MAKGEYIGVSGNAKKVKKIYIGVGGKAKKVKKAYIGVGGKAKLFYSGRSGVFAGLGYWANSGVKYDAESDAANYFSQSGLGNSAYQITYCKGKWFVCQIAGGLRYSTNLTNWTSVSGFDYSSSFECFGMISDENNVYVLVMNNTGNNYYGTGNICMINASTLAVSKYGGVCRTSAASWYGASGDVCLGILPDGKIQTQAKGSIALFDPSNPATATYTSVAAHQLSQKYLPYGRTAQKTGILDSGYYLTFINTTSVLTSKTQTSPQNIQVGCKQLAYGNGIWLMYYNNQIYKSSDGITWTATGALPSYGINYLCYGDGLFVGFSASKLCLYLSENGTTWEEKSLSGMSTNLPCATGLAFSRNGGFGDL